MLNSFNMGDYKVSPPRAKKQEQSRKPSKDSIIIQKPKSKTRVSSPENYKASPSSNKSSQSNINIFSQAQVCPI